MFSISIGRSGGDGRTRRIYPRCRADSSLVADPPGRALPRSISLRCNTNFVFQIAIFAAMLHAAVKGGRWVRRWMQYQVCLPNCNLARRPSGRCNRIDWENEPSQIQIEREEKREEGKKLPKFSLPSFLFLFSGNASMAKVIPKKGRGGRRRTLAATKKANYENPSHPSRELIAFSVVEVVMQ